MGNLLRAITQDGAVAVTTIDSTAIVSEMERIHKTSADSRLHDGGSNERGA